MLRDYFGSEFIITPGGAQGIGFNPGTCKACSAIPSLYSSLSFEQTFRFKSQDFFFDLGNTADLVKFKNSQVPLTHKDHAPVAK